MWFLYTLPLSAQVGCHNLYEQKMMWNSKYVETALSVEISRYYENKTNMLMCEDIPLEYLKISSDQKEMYEKLVNCAFDNYKMTLIFHTILNVCEDKIPLIFEVENNVLPFDIFFTDKHNKVRLIVETYEGRVINVDTHIRSLMKGLAKKEERSFRNIIKRNPEIVFDCSNMFGCFFYEKKGVVYVQDYYRNINVPLETYYIPYMEHNTSTL